MLEIRNLDVFYGQVQALYDVSLTVGSDEAVAVLGANGAGKSTLIKTVIGWKTPQHGSIHFDGRDISRLTPWQRIDLGMALVPEGGRVFRGLTVQENLRLGAYRQADEETIQSRLETVFELFPALAERQRQVAHTLSGGEQQMLAIGRAMMSQPRLLLVDEVSMGLMPILVQRVFETIQKLRERGVAILLVEQNAYEALNVVDRAYVLENGRLVLEGTPAELRENPRVKAAYLGG
ncbi:MAG: ABC transporter ATP-binding protein [Chloroflexi bacterium]|nr:MAG: ABC transporter ATP-binding protein [Chloroflexota bacterium]